ncbi:MAG TPA: ABC transporter ATP-binding protein [Lacunisphaera sp.]|jgi:lipopolysaccharide transport system ATP-binding protein
MGQPVISVASLGKRYHLSHQKQQGTLRDSLMDGTRGFFKKISGRSESINSGMEEFWALRDVSFEINQGDVVGIIGRNGAGKSTLLKVLSRITEPTAGRATIRGRIASLLEVGTGFHPELSGRENIFLNGAILGMSRVEIQRKFDEIVAFAEVERFLDTQVKHYSSGMYVRLAFAVAAHLEPEILILDEVLAVGDADFQRKCLRKMNDVTKKEGRTILFVSHQLTSIQQLCNRVILLKKGRITHDTDTVAGLAAYQAQSSAFVDAQPAVNLGPELTLESFEFSPLPVRVFADLNFVLQLSAQTDCRIHDLCLLLYNELGQRVAIADLRQAAQSYALGAGQTLSLHGLLQRISLVPGNYSVGFYLRTNTHMNDHHGLRSITVHAAENNQLMSYAAEHLGSVALEPKFEVTVQNGGEIITPIKHPESTA